MSTQKINDNSAMPQEVGGIKVFWLFLAMNILPGIIISILFLLSWQEFSRNIIKNNFEYYSVIVSKFIAKDMRDNSYEAKWIIANISNQLTDLPPEERYNFKIADYLANISREEDIQSTGFVTPEGWFAEVFKRDGQLYYHFFSQLNMDNIVYRYDEEGGKWEKTDEKASLKLVRYWNAWYSRAIKNPGAMIHSVPAFISNEQKMEFFYARTLNTEKNTPVVYCHLVYRFPDSKSQRYNPKSVLFKPFRKSELNEESRIKKVLPVYVMNENYELYGSEHLAGQKHSFDVNIKDPATYKNKPTIRKIAENILNGNFALPGKEKDVAIYPLPSPDAPNARVVFVWMEEYKWWMVVILPGEIVSIYDINQLSIMLYIMALLFGVYIVFYLVSRSLLTKPLTRLAWKISNMRELIFAGSSKRHLIKEVNEIEDSLGVFENSFRSFIKFLPRDVILSQIRSGKEAKPEIHRKKLSLFSCRVQNFNDIVEDSPEFLSRSKDFIKLVQHQVSHNSGTLISINNMNITAVWDNYADITKGVRNCCKAVVGCAEDITELNRSWLSQGYTEIRVTLAVYTGYCFVGYFGTEQWLEYSVTGKGVAIVDRMHKLLNECKLLCGVTESTSEFLGDEFILRPAESIYEQGEEELYYELSGLHDDEHYIGKDEKYCKDYTTGWNLINDGRYDKAIDILTDLKRAEPADLLVEKMLGIARQKQAEAGSGPNRQAVDIARKIIEKNI